LGKIKNRLLKWNNDSIIYKYAIIDIISVLKVYDISNKSYHTTKFDKNRYSSDVI